MLYWAANYNKSTRYIQCRINHTAFRWWQLILCATPIAIVIGPSGVSFHVFGKFGTRVSERPDATKLRKDIYLFYNRSRKRIPPPKFWYLFARLCGITAQKFKTSLTSFQEFRDEPCERRVPYSLRIHLYHSCTHLNPFYWMVQYNRDRWIQILGNCPTWRTNSFQYIYL